MSRLDEELIAAHETGDSITLVALYTHAAELAEDSDAAAFYLTHAYVFALEAGLPQAPALRCKLIERGRETPL